jgi:hypothetical protein
MQLPKAPGSEVGGKRKYAERSKKVQKNIPKPPSPPRARVSGFKIHTTGDPTSDDSEESEEEEERVVRPNHGPSTERANFARVVVSIGKPNNQPTDEPREISIPRASVDIKPAEDRAVTRSRSRRHIDIAIDEMESTDSLQENLNQSEGASSIKALESESDDEYADLPELEEENLDEVNTSLGKDAVIIPNLSMISADASMIVHQSEVTTHVFIDDVIRTLKSNGQKVAIRQIIQGPIYPTIPQMERWAAGDGGVSYAEDASQATTTWENHARDPRVNVYRKNIFLRRVGIFREYDEEDILGCTDLLDMYCPADAGNARH